MKPAFCLAFLLALAVPAHAQQKAQKLTPEEQVRKDEILKKNPQLKSQMEAAEKRGLRIKDKEETKHIQMDSVTGKRISPVETPESATDTNPNATGVRVPAKTTVEEPKFVGSSDVAAEAYRKKDYKTAAEHYRALARDGDPQATLIMGIMQQEGQGMKKDKGAAYAWYGRAAELGDGTATEIVRNMNDNDELSKKQKDAAAKQYEDLSKEFDKPEVAKGASTRFDEVKSQSQVNARQYGGSAPKSISGSDSRSTTRPRTYDRGPASTGKTEDFKAGTYNQPTDD